MMTRPCAHPHDPAIRSGHLRNPAVASRRRSCSQNGLASRGRSGGRRPRQGSIEQRMRARCLTPPSPHAPRGLPHLLFQGAADDEPDWLRDWGATKAQEAQASSVGRLEEAQARLQARLQRSVRSYSERKRPHIHRHVCLRIHPSPSLQLLGFKRVLACFERVG